MDKNNRGYIIFSPDGTEPKATVACFDDGKGEDCVINATAPAAIRLTCHILFCLKKFLELPEDKFFELLKEAMEVTEVRIFVNDENNPFEERQEKAKKLLKKMITTIGEVNGFKDNI